MKLTKKLSNTEDVYGLSPWKLQQKKLAQGPIGDPTSVKWLQPKENVGSVLGKTDKRLSLSEVKEKRINRNMLLTRKKQQKMKRHDQRNEMDVTKRKTETEHLHQSNEIDTRLRYLNTHGIVTSNLRCGPLTCETLEHRTDTFMSSPSTAK